MIAKCIGTGSSGNCYILKDNDGKMLLLDCGIPIKDIKIGVDFKVSDIVGCLVTHNHQDHSKSVKDLRCMGINVATPYESEPKNMNFGNFLVRYFRLDDNEGHFVHSNGDGSECPIYGYLIVHDKEPVKILYVTDAQYCKWRFKGITNMILGVDYVDDLVLDDNKAKQLHIYSGHMNIDTACEFIKATDREHTLNSVIIGHMSDTASDRGIFTERLSKATYANIYFAEKGKVIEL